MAIIDTISMETSNGATTIFNYTLDPKENNVYIVDGTMDMTTHVARYDDINIHMILVNNGQIIDSIRMNVSGVKINERISFYKEFKTDKHFDAVTFTFNVLYYR